MLKNCPSSKPLLSTYLPFYDKPNTLHPTVTTMIATHFIETSIVNFSRKVVEPADKPILGAFIAGGFVFASSKLIEEVPYDPHIYFYGEEHAYTVRCWTHGWDIYHPNKAVVYTNYSQDDRPRNWEDNKNWYAYHYGTEHVKHLLNITRTTQFNSYNGTGATLEKKERLVNMRYSAGYITARKLLRKKQKKAFFIK